MLRFRLYALHILLLLSASLFAQSFSKATYYNAASGKKGKALKTALFGIIGNPSTMAYSTLWTYYYDTDRTSDNQVIDRYSNEKRYFSGKSKTAVSGMNKEHGIAQSWWGENKSLPVHHDLHHVVPSDSTANNKKNNYGMGVVTLPSPKDSQIWNNGSIKVGRGTGRPGETISMWEPADEWKGDFAREYFYIVTCYENIDFVQSEGANSMQTGTYPKLLPWAYTLYMQWSKEDPVDDLERKRNEAVYGIQSNRNPFIDYPGLEQYIWGTHTSVPFSASQYANPFEGTTPTPDLDPDPEPQSANSGDYQKVTVEPADWSGIYLIVYEAGRLAMNGGLKESLDAVSNNVLVTIQDNAITGTEAMDAASFFINKATEGYTIKSHSGLYMGRTSDNNGLESNASTAYTNTLSLNSDGTVNILGSGGAYLRYNAASDQTRFRYYRSSSYTGQKAVTLYRKVLILGDLNGDGLQTFGDVALLVDIALGKTVNYNQAVADINGDGAISIADVTALVNIILEK